MMRRKIEQQKEQSATLAETLRTSESARTETRCSRKTRHALKAASHRSTRCKTMKIEDMMKRKIEQQKEQRATLAKKLRTSEPRTSMSLRKPVTTAHSKSSKHKLQNPENRRRNETQKIENKKEQRATLAKTLTTSETACAKNRYSLGQNNRSTSCKTMKQEDATMCKIERQKNREQRWQRRSQQAKLHAPQIDIRSAKIIAAQDHACTTRIIEAQEKEPKTVKS